MSEHKGASRAQVVWGIALVVIGFALFGLQAFDLNVYGIGWPLFIIVPGLLFFVGAFSAPRGAGLTFMAIPGCVVTTTGLILAAQNLTGDWQSWSYVWALVAPTSVGAGLLIAGVREGSSGVRKAGFWLIGIGLVLFAVAEWLMVRVFGVGGVGLGSVFGYVMPALFVILGVYVVTRALWRSGTDV